MSMPFEEWATSVNKKFGKISPQKMYQNLFFRDPIRRNIIDPSVFYSPADGVLMYQKIVHGKKDVISIKGQHYSLSDLMEQEFDYECLVIGIFMTYYDVHVNRIPYGGILKFKHLTPIVSANKPMEQVELDLLHKHFGEAYKNMGGYLKYNARMVNEIYVPSLDYRYYLTQIADDEINVITHFTVEQNQWFNQCQRFSFVRWGSQVELILPIDKRFKLKTLIPDHHHVHGCEDALVKIQ